MGDNKKIAGHVSKVHNRVHFMKSYGKIMRENKIIEKVMNMITLTPRFNHVIVVIQESSDLSTMKLEDLVGSFEVHELRITEKRGVQESIQAL